MSNSLTFHNFFIIAGWEKRFFVGIVVEIYTVFKSETASFRTLFKLKKFQIIIGLSKKRIFSLRNL